MHSCHCEHQKSPGAVVEQEQQEQEVRNDLKPVLSLQMLNTGRKREIYATASTSPES
jgi:hypothetical protein